MALKASTVVDDESCEIGDEQVARRGGPDTGFANDTQLSGLPAACSSLSVELVGGNCSVRREAAAVSAPLVRRQRALL
jgi:hypothetical protein